MLAVKLICVGKLKEAYWRDAVAEYEKRLRPLCKWELIELPEHGCPAAPPSGDRRRPGKGGGADPSPHGWNGVPPVH
mgnify:CR=1 FL=1